MSTNKFSGTCYKCGETVKTGEGELSRWYNPIEDRDEWVVRHTDEKICETNKLNSAAERKLENALYATIKSIEKYIETMGERVNDHTETDGEMLYDGRRSHVGHTIVVDAENTIWLNWHDPTVDGWGSYSYKLTDGDDDGFGNGNADIVSALRNWKNNVPTETKPFEVV